jgi:flavin-binding protein dodecin
MAQKVIEVVRTSKESFAKAAENAVAEAAKTVRGLKWARVAELEMELGYYQLDVRRWQRDGLLVAGRSFVCLGGKVEVVAPGA